MARSFSRISEQTSAEDFGKNNPFFHQPSDSYFAMLQRDGKPFQRRYQLDANGRQVNVMEKQVEYVMGSGNHARTYLYRTAANLLMELPLGWYAEKGGFWGMNPGYDRPDHDGFRRPITYDCMFCHNAYPKVPAGNDGFAADPTYEGPLPEGIDCQRCHGSGERHVQVAGKAGAKREEIRGSIVNPARLGPERQMETCMVCHLESTSFPLPSAIQRFERKAFSYQPGEPLASFLLNFDHAPEASSSPGPRNRDDKFEIVSSAYRLRRSACFLKSDGRMTCTTCHNPHDAPRGMEADRHYTAMCRQCHAEAFEQNVKAGKHTTAEGCVGCHMPKRRTEDVVHVAMTDHLIQRRRPDGNLLAEQAERRDVYRGRVVPYYPATLTGSAEDQVALAVAQVIQGSNLRDGIPQLEAALAKYQPRSEQPWLHLADALRQDGQLSRAVRVYQEAAQRNPKSVAASQKLGTALRETEQFGASAEVLQWAVSLAPGRAATWHELGLTFRALGRSADATRAIQKALELDGDMPEGHNNLGNLLLAAGDRARAEAEFREAIRVRPEGADARANLAALLSAGGLFEQARAEFEAALRLRPVDAATRFNYAMLLGRNGRLDEAQAQCEMALRADAGFTDAHLLLADLLTAKEQFQEAAPHYREVLRVRADSGRAHLGLGFAMVRAGDFAGAALELKQAAAASDAPTREQAAELLRQIGGKL